MGTNQKVVITYVNHRGERSRRMILPVVIVFTSSSYHEGVGMEWMLEAWDETKQAMRTFRLTQIEKTEMPTDQDYAEMEQAQEAHNAGVEKAASSSHLTDEDPEE